MIAKTLLHVALGIAAAATGSMASAAANINIVNGNGPGVGFNDPTPVAPVGGNAGTTLGQQRLNAFAYAASIWGAKLDSGPDIDVLAGFLARSCNATSAVLGSAGPTEVWSDFSGAPLPFTWYHYALADKLADDVLDEDAFPQIQAIFNVNLGKPGCLTGSPFYLGLDSNPPAGQVDLIVVLLHEFGHGLGFSTVTNGQTGAELGDVEDPPRPSTFDHFLYDNTQGKSWVDMTDAERQASGINSRNLVWTGANAVAGAPGVLALGVPKMQIIEPASIAGEYQVGTASFGPLFTSVDLTRQVMPVIENDDFGFACAPFDALNRRLVKNRIAVVLRGTCAFTVKVKNAQDAGAAGVIVIDTTPGGPPAGLGGADPTIKIPAVRITLDDGITLINGMNFNNPSLRSVNTKVRLLNDFSQLAGADTSGRPLMYTPNPYQSGSSVSHWDTIAFPNLLMEPAINTGLTQSVEPPQDLTLSVLKDLGW